jgi:glycosyltransferase involved in cell wall biosynthesis
MNATVVITTKNRREDLVKAVASALTQTANPEVLVIDDGSTDGTAEFMAREFPAVRLHRSEQSLGLIVQRNRAARLASHPIVFSIDDDAVFSSAGVVEQTLREFDHPQVGAVAIPMVDVNTSPAVRQKAPRPDGIYAVYDYIGTAHALRRDLFLQLGGYREVLFHQSEEEDYCLRILNHGYITRAGNADPIHHFESPKRSFARMDYYGARNKVLYAWHNVPFPHLPKHLVATTLLTSVYARHPVRCLTRLRGVANAYTVIGSGRTHRQPVSVASYLLSRRLKKTGPLPLEAIAHCLRSRS